VSRRTLTDDTTFGILHSRFHEVWALRLGTSLEDRPRYTSTTTFATFPFPAGLTPDRPASEYANNPVAERIAVAARRLVQLRDAWLNPPELARREPEIMEGFPDRIVPIKANDELRRRTLTNLYNAKPTWLANAHRVLDEAVGAAYGFPPDLPEDELLPRLLEVNQARASGRVD
jgi:type II restriction/modification system DNA methylase subunit YeeA